MMEKGRRERPKRPDRPRRKRSEEKRQPREREPKASAATEETISAKSPSSGNSIDLFNTRLETSTLDMVPRSFAKEHSIFPVRKNKNALIVAMNNPNDFNVLNELRLMTGYTIEPRQASASDIDQMIAREYQSDMNIDGLFQDTGAGEENSAVQNIDSVNNDEAPIIKLVSTLLRDSIDRKASDIHFDPQEKYMIVRIRVDGELIELKTLPKNVQQSVTSRIKIISSLDITETRVPQDGRAMLKTGSKMVDLRVSILPTVHGEKIVIRILDRSTGIRKLEEFNFNPKSLKALRQLLALPHGIFLVTGPTGSGKSSTLYASLNELNTPNVNIITVEDPVEFQLEGINQVAVNASVGLTFASGLRSILRQDPNIVMLGEIRDAETAEIAIRASMTGHLVISTLHTNDSIGTVNRLIDMGIDPFLVANSLTGVLAQRLVRTICSNCKIEVTPDPDEVVFLKEHGLTADKLYKGKGCSKCGNSGFSGRMAIQELLVVTPELREKIAQNAPVEDLTELALKNDMIFLLKDGLIKVTQGMSTIQEVLRVAAAD